MQQPTRPSANRTDPPARRSSSAESSQATEPWYTGEPAESWETNAPFARSISEAVASFLPEGRNRRIAVAGVAVALALVSFFIIGTWASSPETYADTFASLDAKRETVMGLVGGSTGMSAAITLLPGDAGTPIAEKLLDIGADFAIVIGAIYLEKYLLTVLGFAAFKVLVPIACILFAAAALLTGRGERFRAAFVGGAVKLALFGVAIALVVPASVFVSDMIDSTYESSAAATLEAAEKVSQEAQSSASAAAADENAESANASPGGIIEFVQSIPDTVAHAAEGVSTEAQEVLNGYIETLAVMIVTSCVIPILVLLFFLWLVKALLGVNVSAPMQMLAPRSLRRGMRR